MIYTVTCNPSLDYILTVENLTLGSVNRTTGELLLPGGKGINVSLVLNNLGMKSTALGFTAGFTGQEIRRRIAEAGICDSFIHIENGLSRINVKIRSDEESEINGLGPAISGSHLEQFYGQLDGLQKGDVLVLAGSIPSMLPATLYRDIMERLADKGICIVVDATRDLLCNVLPLHPFLIKPNHIELGEIFGVTLTDKKDVLVYAKKMQAQGARNVLVSMAGEGAVLVSEDGQAFESAAPKGTVVNSVGAGDSMVAGFLYGYFTEQNYETAFYYGLAAGSASAFSENLATKEEVNKILQNVGRR